MIIQLDAVKTTCGEQPVPMLADSDYGNERDLDIPSDRMTLHGFRGMERTILDEVLGFQSDFVENHLTHAVRDSNGRAYTRTVFPRERRATGQEWAGYLDGLQNVKNPRPTCRSHDVVGSPDPQAIHSPPLGVS